MGATDAAVPQAAISSKVSMSVNGICVSKTLSPKTSLASIFNVSLVIDFKMDDDFGV